MTDASPPEVSRTTAALIELLQRRDAAGRAKYGVTLDRDDLSLRDWLQHQAEELLDGAGYAVAGMRGLARLEAAERTLQALGYTYHGAAMWKPPIGEAPAYVADDASDAATDAKSQGLRIEARGPSGSLSVMFDDFEFVRVNYHYRYTDNRHRRWLAERIEDLIRNGDGESQTPAQLFQPGPSMPTSTRFKVERHGNGWAIYQGRDMHHHGANLGQLTECGEDLPKAIERALNSAPSIPAELLDRIEGALDRHVTGASPRRVPVDMTDSDLVLDDLRRIRAGKKPRDWTRRQSADELRDEAAGPKPPACARCGGRTAKRCGSPECPNGEAATP